MSPSLFELFVLCLVTAPHDTTAVCTAGRPWSVKLPNVTSHILLLVCVCVVAKMHITMSELYVIHIQRV